MTSAKMIIAISAIVVLTLSVVGLAAAQIVQNQFYTRTQTNVQSPNTGFWGWIGNCFGWRTTTPQTINQQVPLSPVQPTQPVEPNVPTVPNQGGYGYGYGYGPCWAYW